MKSKALRNEERRQEEEYLCPDLEEEDLLLEEDLGTGKTWFYVHFRRVTPDESLNPSYSIPDEVMGVLATTEEEAWDKFLDGISPEQRGWYQRIII